MDKSLFLITLFNYVAGFGIISHMKSIENTNEGMFVFPFIWFIFIVIILEFVSGLKREQESDKKLPNEKFGINIILLIINCFFPLIGLFYALK